MMGGIDQPIHLRSLRAGSWNLSASFPRNCCGATSISSIEYLRIPTQASLRTRRGRDVSTACITIRLSPHTLLRLQGPLSKPLCSYLTEIACAAARCENHERMAYETYPDRHHIILSDLPISIQTSPSDVYLRHRAQQPPLQHVL